MNLSQDITGDSFCGGKGMKKAKTNTFRNNGNLH